MGKPPTPGYCPYCRTALNSGATACTGCSAFETTGWDELGIWKNALLGPSFFIPPIIALFVAFISPLVAGVIWIAPIVAYFYFRSRLKKKIVWAADGRYNPFDRAEAHSFPKSRLCRASERIILGRIHVRCVVREFPHMTEGARALVAQKFARQYRPRAFIAPQEPLWLAAHDRF
jgi:hypothetical protein